MSFALSFLLRAVSSLGHIALLWAVSQIGGPDNVGQMVFYQAIVITAATLATLGHNSATMRQFSLAPLARHSYNLLGLSALIVVPVAALVSISFLWAGNPLIFWLNIDSSSLAQFSWYLPAIPLASVALLLGGYFKGIGRPNIAILTDAGMVSLLAVVVLLTLRAVTDSAVSFQQLVAAALVISYSAVAIITLAFLFLTLKTHRTAISQSSSSSPTWAEHLRVTARLQIANISELLNAMAPVIILGALIAEETLASFRLAERMAVLVGFGLFVVNYTIPPSIGKALSENDNRALQRVLSDGANKAGLVAILLALPILAFAPHIIDHFEMPKYPTLLILYILIPAQFVNVVSGSTMITLKLSNHTKFLASFGMSMTILYLVTLPFVVRISGIEGVAIATAGFLIVTNVICAAYLGMKLHVLPLPLWDRFTRKEI